MTLDKKLSSDEHTTDIQKKSHQRLSVICKLKGLYVVPHYLLLFYQSIIQPILLYCSICFFNMLSVKNDQQVGTVYNFNHSYILTLRDRISQKKSRITTSYTFYKFIIIFFAWNKYLIPYQPAIILAPTDQLVFQLAGLPAMKQDTQEVLRNQKLSITEKFYNPITWTIQKETGAGHGYTDITGETWVQRGWDWIINYKNMK